MNILGLADWQVLDVSETAHDMQIEARYTPTPSACPHCGCVANLYRHGVKQQRYMDLPVRAKRVGILAHRQRYKCRDCGQTFMQPIMIPIEYKHGSKPTARATCGLNRIGDLSASRQTRRDGAGEPRRGQ